MITVCITAGIRNHLNGFPRLEQLFSKEHFDLIAIFLRRNTDRLLEKMQQSGPRQMQMCGNLFIGDISVVLTDKMQGFFYIPSPDGNRLQIKKLLWNRTEQLRNKCIKCKNLPVAGNKRLFNTLAERFRRQFQCLMTGT